MSGKSIFESQFDFIAKIELVNQRQKTELASVQREFQENCSRIASSELASEQRSLFNKNYPENIDFFK